MKRGPVLDALSAYPVSSVDTIALRSGTFATPNGEGLPRCALGAGASLTLPRKISAPTPGRQYKDRRMSPVLVSGFDRRFLPWTPFTSEHRQGHSNPAVRTSLADLHRSAEEHCSTPNSFVKVARVAFFAPSYFLLGTEVDDSGIAWALPGSRQHFSTPGL